MSERVPTETLTQAAGCSASTIQRWVRLGLLPCGVRVNSGDGRGVRTWFPASALADVRTIQARRGQGATLEEIAAELKAARGEPEKRPRRKR